MNRYRFLRVLWLTLFVYELLCVFLIWILKAHPPVFVPPALITLLSFLFYGAMVLPFYLLFSFRGVVPRWRPLNVLFFLFYFAAGVFLAGMLTVEMGIALHNVLNPHRHIDGSIRWSLGEESGAALLLILFGQAFLARIRPPRVIRKTLTYSTLAPDLSGVTILHLSDLHVGAWQGEDSLRRIARTVEDLSPDILLFTGDMIDHRADEGAIFERVFGNLRGRLGTFAVLGNHEYWTLGGKAQEIMKRHGAPILKNESRTVQIGEGTIRVVGIDDPAGGEECEECGPDIAKALKEVSANDFVLALVHQPTLWDGELKGRAHLTVAGHTHGGQIGGRRPFWNLARIFFQYDAGLFKEAFPEHVVHYLHVSSGLGYYGVPIRLGMAPEMTLITLAASP